MDNAATQRRGGRRIVALSLGLMTLAFGPARSPAPNPIVSRSQPVFASESATDAAALVDGLYGRSGPGASWSPAKFPAWVAIRIGAGPSRLLLGWSAPGNQNYTGSAGAPRDYSIEVSANTTNGSDGDWTTAAWVTGNPVRARFHSFDFSGNSWVRLTVASAPNGLSLDEIDVHDVSSGVSDSWFFMGDSIVDLVFDRSPGRQPSFAALVHEAFPAYFPAMTDGGIYGETSADGARRVDELLALNPDALYWAIGYGTNDSGRKVDPEVFQSNLQTIVNRLRSAGRIPMIARIPRPTAPGYATIPTLNERIDAVAAANGLAPGPDLYGWFTAVPGQIGADGIHPTDAGAVSINRLWAEAATRYYVPPPPTPAPPPPDPPPPPAEPQPAAPSGNRTGSGNSTKDKKCGIVGWEMVAVLGLARMLGRRLTATGRERPVPRPPTSPPEAGWARPEPPPRSDASPPSGA